MWVLQQITLGLCSLPSQCWCRVEKARLWVLVRLCQTSSFCASSTPGPCSPAGLTAFAGNTLLCPCPFPTHCCEPRHRPGCLSCSIFPVQSDEMSCYLIPGHGPVLTPKPFPRTLPYTQP